MKIKTNQELLNQLTKANRTYKLKLAIKAGFSTVEEYKNHLIRFTIKTGQTKLTDISQLNDTKPWVEIVKVTKASIKHVFESSINKKAKISFNKKLDLNYVHDVLSLVYDHSIPSLYHKNLKKAINKDLFEGEERIMNYTFHGKYDSNGLAYVTDLDQPENDNLRVLDINRINWIEIDNVKNTL